MCSRAVRGSNDGHTKQTVRGRRRSKPKDLLLFATRALFRDTLRTKFGSWQIKFGLHDMIWVPAAVCKADLMPGLPVSVLAICRQTNPAQLSFGKEADRKARLADLHLDADLWIASDGLVGQHGLIGVLAQVEEHLVKQCLLLAARGVEVTFGRPTLFLNLTMPAAIAVADHEDAKALVRGMLRIVVARF